MSETDFEWPSDEEIDDFFANRSPFMKLPSEGRAEKETLARSGTVLAYKIATKAKALSQILVVAGPADYEAFASTLVETLETLGYDVKIACLWEGSPGGMIVGSFVEDGHAEADWIVLARAVVASDEDVVSPALWTTHKAPAAGLAVACHLIGAADARRLSSKAEPTLYGRPALVLTTNATTERRAFDDLNPYRGFPEADDATHTPKFVETRMERQAARRKSIA